MKRCLPHFSGKSVTQRITTFLKNIMLLSMLFFFVNSAVAIDLSESYETLANARSSFSDKSLAIKTIASSNSPEAALILEALDHQKLFFHKHQGSLYIQTPQNSLVNVFDKTIYQGKPRDLKRVAINNQNRDTIALAIAMRAISDPNLTLEQRIASAHDLIGRVNSEDAQELAGLRDLEYSKNPELAQMLSFVVAAADLDHEDPRIRNGAMRILEDFNSPLLIDKLDSIAKNDADTSNRVFASQQVKSLKSKQDNYGYAETIFFGLSLGSVLVLAAIGLTITFGVMGVINMAHGELMMIGAYTVFVMQQLMPNYPGVALLLSIPAAFCVSGIVGMIIERGVIHYLYGRPLETLLATFGISLLLQQAVRSIFSALNRNVVIPDFMSGAIVINDFFSITYNRLYIIFFCLAVFFLLRHILQHSRLGLEVRAVSQNRAMAQNMGVRSARVNALTFGLGSGIAGLAGVALSQLTNVGPNLGQNYIVDSFLVVVFGGAGNIWGTMVAGMSLGLANKILEPISGAMLAKIIILVFVIFFIQKHPRGLFPQRGRSVED